MCNGGGGGGSSSSSSNSTTTQNTDKRIAVESGIGISSDSSSITVNALDGDIVKQALDVVGTADAANGEGFTKLLTLADKLFTAGGTILETSAANTQANIAAMQTTMNDAAGKVDQKTLLIVGGLIVAGFYVRKKGAA